MRWSTASAYLRDAMKRPNLTVLSKTMTDRVIFNGTTAQGIEVSDLGNPLQKETFYGEEVILSGGAINSPQLLQLSGIGNADELKGLGVEPVVDLKGVGENLQDHLELYVQQESKLPGKYEL